MSRLSYVYTIQCSSVATAYELARVINGDYKCRSLKLSPQEKGCELEIVTDYKSDELSNYPTPKD